MSAPNQSIWSDINTAVEIGIEIYNLLSKQKTDDNSLAEKIKEILLDKALRSGSEKNDNISFNKMITPIANGIFSISNETETVVLIDKTLAESELSAIAAEYGRIKCDYIVYDSTTAAIGLMLNMHVFWGVACMVLAIKTPKFLAEFVVPSSGGGSGVVNNVYHSVKLVGMAKNMIK